MPRRRQEVRDNLERLYLALAETEFASKIPLLRKQDGCPLVEEIEGDPENRKVTFFYHADEGERFEEVGVTSSPFTKMDGHLGPMKKLVRENVFALTVALPAESCFTYIFEIKQSEGFPTELKPDALNPKVFSSTDQSGSWSIFDSSPLISETYTSLDDLKDDGRLKKYAICDTGDLIARGDGYTPQENERMLTVHFPKNHDATHTYSMRLFLDGEWYLKECAVPALLDDDPCTINIMLDPEVITGRVEKDREFEYNIQPGVTRDIRCFNVDRFAKFLARELIPCVQKKFKISTEACDITLCGASLGGFAAIYIGLHYPDIFGNVLAQSPEFSCDQLEAIGLDDLCLNNQKIYEQLYEQTAGEFGQLIIQGIDRFEDYQIFVDNLSGFNLINLVRLRKSFFYLEVGLFEEDSFLQGSHDFINKMCCLTIPCRCEERPAGHEFVSWQKFLPKAVRQLQEMRKGQTAPEEEKGVKSSLITRR